jgi:hypothetical protein
MNKSLFQNLLPHFVALILCFLFVVLVFFSRFGGKQTDGT